MAMAFGEFCRSVRAPDIVSNVEDALRDQGILTMTDLRVRVGSIKPFLLKLRIEEALAMATEAPRVAAPSASAPASVRPPTTLPTLAAGSETRLSPAKEEGDLANLLMRTPFSARDPATVLSVLKNLRITTTSELQVALSRPEKRDTIKDRLGPDADLLAVEVTRAYPQDHPTPPQRCASEPPYNLSSTGDRHLSQHHSLGPLSPLSSAPSATTTTTTTSSSSNAPSTSSFSPSISATAAYAPYSQSHTNVPLMSMEINVIGGDIALQSVDAIVCPVKGNLFPGGKVCEALSRADSSFFVRDSYHDFALKHTQGPLKEGHIFVTGAGALHAKNIIYVVRPQITLMQRVNDERRDTLRKVVVNTLLAADDAGHSSVALPVISSGILKYPVQDACKVLIDACIQFRNAQRRHVREVRIVTTDTSEVRHLLKFLEASAPSTSHTSTSTSIAHRSSGTSTSTEHQKARLPVSGAPPIGRFSCVTDDSWHSVGSDFAAAGVLPVRMSTTSRRPKVLLTVEYRLESHGRKLHLFGGKRDRGEDRPSVTARREFREELAKLVDKQDIATFVSLQANPHSRLLWVPKGRYFLFVAPLFPSNPLLPIFTKLPDTYNTMRHRPISAEAESIAWVDWDAVCSAAEHREKVSCTINGRQERFHLSDLLANLAANPAFQALVSSVSSP